MPALLRRLCGVASSMEPILLAFQCPLSFSDAAVVACTAQMQQLSLHLRPLQKARATMQHCCSVGLLSPCRCPLDQVWVYKRCGLPLRWGSTANFRYSVVCRMPHPWHSTILLGCLGFALSFCFVWHTCACCVSAPLPQFGRRGEF